MKKELELLFQGKDMTEHQSYQVFSQVVKGTVDNITLSSLLTALKIKRESPEEIAGAAKALIENAKPIARPDYPFADIVGTGGDGHHTLNISSTAAIVAAACGVKVAKHGNRSVSSRSGSADLFEAFGLNLTMSAATARTCLDQSGLCFLFAPTYHAGIKHAMEVRTTLKTHTLFNLLGPLVNPARPSHIMIGINREELLHPFAKTLQILGYKNAMVVHGSGLDELALHGPSQVMEVKGSQVTSYTLFPADLGIPPFKLEDIQGGTPEENKKMIKDILQGKGHPAHEASVALNTAALLKLTGHASDFAQGYQQARDVIRSGKALATIEKTVQLSQKENES